VTTRRPRRRQAAAPPTIWQRIPAWGKYAAALGAMAAFLGAMAGYWTSWGLPHPAFRPAYDDFVSEMLTRARGEIERKVGEVEKTVTSVSAKADRNNHDQLETKLATLAVHESLLRAQLTALERDKAYANSFSLRNRADELRAHIESLRKEHTEVQTRLRADRGS